jgi:hypothetical protein
MEQNDLVAQMPGKAAAPTASPDAYHVGSGP